MRLVEIFNRPSKYVWNVKSNDKWKGVFKVGDIDYEFYAINSHAISTKLPKYWELGFQTTKGYKQSLTGTGNELEVFSTVIEMIKEFAKKQQPEEVRVHVDTDDSETRLSLYRRLLLKFASGEGYKIEEHRETFYITKIDQ